MGWKWVTRHGARMGFTWGLVGLMKWAGSGCSHMEPAWVLHGVWWARLSGLEMGDPILCSHGFYIGFGGQGKMGWKWVTPHGA